MANDFYNPSGYPAPNAPGASASMRAELDLIEQGFEKLPALSGNGNKLVSVNEAGTALVANDDIVQVDFDTAGGADAVARLVWNDTDGTLNLGLKGGNVVLQIGQEEVLRVLNNTGAGLTSGQAVYITGASGQRPTVALAQANSEMASSKVLGIVTETIANNAQGFATTAGIVRGINTIALTEGAVVYVSASVAGGLTSTRPTQPNHSVMVGYCIRSHTTDGMIYTMVQNGYELDELHDVLITSLANNNMLKWDSATGVWRNVAGPAGAVVGTTDAQELTNKTISGGTVSGAAVTGLATPVNASDAASKAYVDSVTEGLDVKASVRVATTANIILSNTQTIDGIALIAGDRVLVKDQTAASANGIYVVAAGAWPRSSDADAWTELVSAFTFVEAGTANAGNGYICTVAAGGTLGVTAVTWAQFSSAGQLQPGAGLTRTGNTLDVGTASASRIVVNANSIDLATAGTAGTYRSVTTDAYGRVTAGTNPTTLAGYGITDAYTKTYIDTLYGDTASAAASAAAAAASYDAFDDRWLGAKASDPSVDNDGNALQAGAVYFSTTLAQMRVYTGLAWQNATTLPNGVFQNSFTATAGQTSYTWTGGSSYAVGFLYVYVNGVLLATGDYTATDGANISFSTALTAGDEVQLLTFKAAGAITPSDIGAAPLNSPGLTGTPTAPTAALGTNTTQVATTAFVNAEIANDAPTKTGGGASGTWGISITGNAATVSSITSGQVTGALGYTPPQPNGTGASGTWAINISGNAATATSATTATTASSANSVAWTNVSGRPTAVSQFSNDSGYITSAGRAYPRRSDGTNIDFYWSGQAGQPTWLWGGNDGVSFYVYNPSNFNVNYANSAGSANSVAWTNVSGRPTTVSSFTNDAGYITTAGVSTSSVLSATAGASVDAVGTYIYAFSTITGNNTSGGTISGINLRPAYEGSGSTGGGSLSGTWRIMGYAPSGMSYSTLFLRIA